MCELVLDVVGAHVEHFIVAPVAPDVKERRKTALDAISLLKPLSTTMHGSPETSSDSDVVGETGIEPVTPDLEGPCSIQLSYSPLLCLIAARDALQDVSDWRTRTG